ncbi:hypothetical protein GA0070611_4331 [Micromonospora auratinigra]|uniref:Uncharacterized protein n=1 Tax=Micromonospora auratinigra TaxID=261654 RepID=A0A1A8ZZ69_9ACTN|nr:hypothetical protein GA0070611_4331 [Micromonospora auratinigra]
MARTPERASPVPGVLAAVVVLVLAGTVGAVASGCLLILLPVRTVGPVGSATARDDRRPTGQACPAVPDPTNCARV